MPRREDLTRRCAVEGCDGGVYNVANGWCNKHYVRYWRTGSLELKPRPLRSDLSYAGAHGRVRRELGNANLNPCVDCGEPATDWAYDRTDPDESVGFQKGRHRVVYSQWPEFYKPLCHRCHALLDQGVTSASRTHCVRGHALSDESIYTPPGTRSRFCRVCRKEANRRWRIKNGHPDPALNPRRSSTGHKNVARQGKGFRAVITIRGEKFIGPTRATPELAAEDRDAFIARKKKEEGKK